MRYLVSRLEVGSGRVQHVKVSNCAWNDDDIVEDLDEEACPTGDKQQQTSWQLSLLDPKAVMQMKLLCDFLV